jgi:hypothetical protein
VGDRGVAISGSAASGDNASPVAHGVGSYGMNRQNAEITG